MRSDQPANPSRRDFVKSTSTAGIAAGVSTQFPSTALAKSSLPDVREKAFTQQVTLTINSQKHTLEIDTRTTLLDLLREKLTLTGTKKGCVLVPCW